MLNDGQRRQSEITIKGEKLFADVTGKTHLKEMDAFAGPGAETVDIGLTDTKGNSVPLNHAMLCSLYMHLQNADSRQHLLNGGLTVPSMEQYTKGNIERAYQEGQTVHLGGLQNAGGTPMVDTVLQTVENALTDYDRAWIADMQELFNRYTTNLINETSMQLLGYNRAGVKNYYPIAVDKSALATQIEGLNLDATIEGRGFLKNRVKKAVQPILLEECNNVVQRSIRDTAAYAGLALPIRDVQKVLNSNVETKDGDPCPAGGEGRRFLGKGLRPQREDGLRAAQLRQTGIGFRDDGAGTDRQQLFHHGQHLIRPQAAVGAQGRHAHVLHGLGKDGGRRARQADALLESHGDHDGQVADLTRSRHGGPGFGQVELGLNEDEVRPTGHEAADLFREGLDEFLRLHIAQRTGKMTARAHVAGYEDRTPGLGGRGARGLHHTLVERKNI